MRRKRIHILTMAAALIFCICIIPVSADSGITVNDPYLSIIPHQAGDQVIPIYDMNLPEMSICCGYDFQTMLDHVYQYPSSIKYAVIHQTGETSFFYINEEDGKATILNSSKYTMEQFLYADITEYLEKDVEVYAQYLFTDFYHEYNIYFETNLGDYVYCNFQLPDAPYYPPAGEYFFSLQDYWNFESSMIDTMRRYYRLKERDEDTNDYQIQWNLDSHRVDSDRFDPNSSYKDPTVIRGDEVSIHIFITCALLFITGCVICSIWAYKKWFVAESYQANEEMTDV